MDQISYSLFFRDLIDERIKYRVVCPKCQTPRNLKLLATKKVGYDPKTKEFYLVCDNPDCQGARKDRLEKDEELINRALLQPFAASGGYFLD